MSFAQTNSGFYIFIYIQTGHSIYILSAIYLCTFIYTFKPLKHTDTKKKIKGVGGGFKQNTEDTSGHGADLQI